MNQIEIKISEYSQKELNNIRKKCGLKEEPIDKDMKLKALFGGLEG